MYASHIYVYIHVSTYRGSAGQATARDFAECWKKRNEYRNRCIANFEGVGDSAFGIFVADVRKKIANGELTYDDVVIQIRFLGLEASDRDVGTLGGIRAALLYGEQIAIREAWSYTTNINRSHVSLTVSEGFTSESAKAAGKFVYVCICTFIFYI